jgi:hypothetical protein
MSQPDPNESYHLHSEAVASPQLTPVSTTPVNLQEHSMSPTDVHLAPRGEQNANTHPP